MISSLRWSIYPYISELVVAIQYKFCLPVLNLVCILTGKAFGPVVVYRGHMHFRKCALTRRRSKLLSAAAESQRFCLFVRRLARHTDGPLRTLFDEQNQLIPQAALGPCYRDHGCQIAAIVIFREVLQKTSQHITEWKDGNAASNAEQLRVAVCQGSFVILSEFNLKRQRTATERLFIQLKIRTWGDTRCTKDRSTKV
ncbi:hypothetical protein T05_7009 [Trichinella murrelli]|uniref:Uncharacterized protein n=1 Tax=Trichinella murrelli TaxID=144512 RepID=A0A0V0TBX2_9BILA|nr:hypothetical protein T05_7009 [Trichinella murrelli]